MTPLDQAQYVDFLSPTDFTVGKTLEFSHSLFPFLRVLDYPSPLRSPLITISEGSLGGSATPQCGHRTYGLWGEAQRLAPMTKSVFAMLADIMCSFIFMSTLSALVCPSCPSH